MTFGVQDGTRRFLGWGRWGGEAHEILRFAQDDILRLE